MIDPYVALIGASSLIILSYFFNIISTRLRIPSVIFLIGTGVIIKYVATYFEFEIEGVDSVLHYLGIIGLIMIVLEGALDLHITREKMMLVWQSFASATIIFLVTAFAIAYIIMQYVGSGFTISLINAIPLSIVSSAIVISSVSTLTKSKQEFMVYESTFSDIIGIMFFNFLLTSEGSSGQIAVTVSVNILITIVVSAVSSYLLVYSFQKIKTHIKLFLMISILMLLYSLGKFLHISALLIILVFGLILNNAESFFIGPLSKMVKRETLVPVVKDFKIVTNETTFLIRTFFFVIFGMSFDLRLLLDGTVVIIGLGILAVLYLVRFIYLKIFLKTNLFPELLLAPRGLVTVLVFYSILPEDRLAEVGEGLLFFLIIFTNMIMMIGLLFDPKHRYVEEEVLKPEVHELPGASLLKHAPFDEVVIEREGYEDGPSPTTDDAESSDPEEK